MDIDSLKYHSDICHPKPGYCLLQNKIDFFDKLDVGVSTAVEPFLQVMQTRKFVRSTCPPGEVQMIRWTKRDGTC